MKKLLLFSVILTFLIEARAQDPQFTQFYANPIYLNPAFAGTSGGPRFAMNYRNQWPSIGASFVTYTASYDQHFDVIGGGIGFQALYDQAGDGELSTTKANFMYSYHLRVSKKFSIKAGLQASITKKSLDFNKLLWRDQIDNRLGFIYNTQEPLPNTNGKTEIEPFTDFSAGILGFTKKFYAGFAVHHINEPEQSFLGNPGSTLPMKMTGHIGMLIPMDKEREHKSFFSPNILYQKQDHFMQLNVGAYYINKFFITGVWYRQTSVNSDAVMALIGVKKDQLKFGYSYDITISDVNKASLGSHEISLIVEMKVYKRPPPKHWQRLDCPDF
ncbi:MAG: type IX secretion system membrane protein PorP/SprF [Bacteroidota bacterium]|nr:type IX secretion system membrane protein PorP/SprF [Bacteroidota bacterium]